MRGQFIQLNDNAIKYYFCCKYCLATILVLLICSNKINGQNNHILTPTITTPKPATIQPGVVIQGMPVTQPNVYQPSYGVSIQEQNARIIQEVQQHQQQQMEAQRQMQEAVNELESKELDVAACLTFVRRPDYSSLPGTEYFHNALDGIGKMLTIKRV